MDEHSGEIEPGTVIDMAGEVIGLSASHGEACLMAHGSGPPVRLEGHTIGLGSLTADSMPPHSGEMHPDGDEVLITVSGVIDVDLELDSGTRTVRVGPGQALVVPKGVWHLIRLVEPGQVVNITRGLAASIVRWPRFQAENGRQRAASINEWVSADGGLGMVGAMSTPDIASFDPFAGPPQLHGARRFGVRPGTELIHPLAVSGERPLRFEVAGLPDGLTVDGDGIVRGVAPAGPGEHALVVTATNALGAIVEPVTLCLGDTLALTPPMGWNSWNVYGATVSAEVVLAVAQAMVDTGMRDLGYSYINIDDFWHASARSADGRPLTNPETFPGGIAPVAERVHQLGLKLGIYSDAAELTCGGCFGSLGHEQVDAAAYAEWGVDLLKYDYCHAPVGRDAAIERYGAMGRALAEADRSIVFSVCEWGLRQPWRWAADLGGSLWRTTPDIFDSYSWLPLGVRGLAARNVKLNRYARPGHWNDPDMLLVGNRGRGRSTGELRLPKGPRPKVWSFRGISDVQAHSHMTLWAMMAAPLLTSHDLASTGEFDRRLLTNPEILAINQDELGVQARKVSPRFRPWVLAKPLADGSLAVSITNMGRRTRWVSLPLGEVGWAGDAEVRDVWRMRDVGRLDRLDVELAPFASVAYVCRQTD